MPALVPLIPFRIRRRRRPAARAPVEALTLVAAAYDPGAAVELTFDRAIDVDAMDVSAVTVWDGPAGFQYGGADVPALVSPDTVRVAVVGVAEWTGTGVTMTVTAASGIVSAVGGLTWAGVSGLSLPWP
jgi:hypothetical protein